MVFADEPTGNLDSESTQSILDLFLRLNAAGQTIVMVTHNPGVAGAAGRTIAMRDGRIEEKAVDTAEAVATGPAVPPPPSS